MKIDNTSIVSDSYQYLANVLDSIIDSNDEKAKFVALFEAYGWTYPSILLSEEVGYFGQEVRLSSIDIKDLYSVVYSHFYYDMVNTLNSLSEDGKKVGSVLDVGLHLLECNPYTTLILSDMLFCNIFMMSNYVPLSVLADDRNSLINRIINILGYSQAYSNEYLEREIFLFFWLTREHTGDILYKEKSGTLISLSNEFLNWRFQDGGKGSFKSSQVKE